MNTDGVVYLIHALAALALLGWLFRQYGWKKLSSKLQGSEREQARSKHEQTGQLTMVALIVVVSIAVIANIWRGVSAGNSIAKSLIPTSLHGATGLIGTILFYYVWSRGRMAKERRELGEPWSATKKRHGRAADLIMIIGCIHAFLGFLELMKLI